MTEYALPNLANTPVGVFTVTVFSEFAGLTIPTVQTIEKIGDTEEINQREVGVSEISSLQLTLLDDHDTYDEGFWWKVLNGESYIRINLIEGVSETAYFFGIPEANEQNSTDNSLFNSEFARSHEVKLVSVGLKLFDTLTVDWITEVLANKQDTTIAASTPIATTIRFQVFLAALVKAAGLSATTDPAFVSFVYDAANPDIKWKIGVTVYTFEELYVPIDYDNGAGDTLSDYYDSAKVVYLPTKYPFAKDLLRAILFNMGLVLRIVNTPEATPTSGFVLTLVQKGGRAYSGTLTFEAPKSSVWAKASDLLGDAVKFFKTHDNDKFVWRSRSGLGEAQADYSVAVPPETEIFDIDRPFVFEVNPAPAAGNSWPLYAGATGGDLSLLVPLDGVEVWDYKTDAYMTPTEVGDLMLEELMTAYEFFKFTDEFTEVERTYGPMVADAGSGETQSVINIMRRNDINDGQATRTFYANKVVKNPDADEVTVQWILE